MERAETTVDIHEAIKTPATSVHASCGRVRVEIVKATYEHAEMMAPFVREADRDELWATCLITPLRALTVSVEASAKAWTGFINDEPICMFGVSPISILGGVGAPWMIGTYGIYRHAKTLLSHSKRCLDEMLESYPVLMNYVDARNKAAIRWLRWLGFTIYEPEPWGILKLPFHRFEMRREGTRYV